MSDKAFAVCWAVAWCVIAAFIWTIGAPRWAIILAIVVGFGSPLMASVKGR